MPYATQNDLVPRRLTEQALGQLTDDSGADVVNADLITQVLTEASGAIDSYCRLRYALPLQPSEQIKGLALDIAMYMLYSRRDRVTDNARQRYVDAIQFLKDVSLGNAALDQPSTAQPQTGGGGAVASTKPERFSDCNLEGFI